MAFTPKECPRPMSVENAQESESNYISIYIDKNLPAESNPISFDHLLRLLKDNANPDTFLSQLYFTADRFLKRLTSKQSIDHEMLHNTILAIHRMERAAQSANKWAFLKLIEDQMSAFVCVTIARLRTTTGIPDDTYSLMQECSCVKQNAAYRKMVELHEGKMFNEISFIDVAKIKPIAPVTDSDRTLARLSPLRYKYIATMRRRQGGEINATYVLPFSHLYWLIADHKTNKTFAEKLTLYSDEFLLRLRDKNLDSTMDNAHVRNLAIALWRVENSSRCDWWEENIKACLDNFVRYQLTKLILDGTLENETINLLLNVELLNQHEQLRKLLGLEAFVQSESEQDSDEEEETAVVQRPPHSSPLPAEPSTSTTTADATHQRSIEETVVVQRPPHSIPLKKSFRDVFPDFRTDSGQLRHTFDRYYGKEDKATGTLKPIWDVLWTTVAFEETVKYVKDNCITTKEFIPDLIIDQCRKKGDAAEAVYWTKYYGLPKNKQPSDIQKNWNTERVVRCDGRNMMNSSSIRVA